MRDSILNFSLYQLGWFGCVLGAAAGLPEAGAALGWMLVLLHLALARSRGVEAALVAAASGLGLLLASFEQYRGLLDYAGRSASDWAPLWVVALWAQLGTTLRGSLSWLQSDARRAGLFGLLGGPLAFLAGERLGAVGWTSPRWVVAIWLAASWGLAVWALAHLARRLGRDRAAGYRMPFGRSEGRSSRCQIGAESGSERKARMP